MHSARRFNEVLKGSLIEVGGSSRDYGGDIEVLNIDVDDRLQMLSHEAFMNGLMRPTGAMENNLDSTVQINQAAINLLEHYRQGTLKTV